MSTILLTQAAADAPVACTLTGDEYRSRTGDLSNLARRALLTREPVDGGERLTFADSPAVERELRAAVTAEASCCSFLTMRLQRAAAGLVLDITGPVEAREVVAQLFA